MDKLAHNSSLLVEQQKEWGEIITGFETKNKYAIFDESKNQLYVAAEQQGSWFTRQFLTANRPFEVVILDEHSNIKMRVTRPFRFIFHEATVTDSQGAVLGRIQKNFSFISKKYTLFSGAGKALYTLKGPILRPWTFNIERHGQEVGKITKQWSGLLKESFSDADNFGIVFPDGIDVSTKAFLLGVVFLIDFVHFENKGD